MCVWDILCVFVCESVSVCVIIIWLYVYCLSSVVKNLPATQETRGPIRGRESPLGEGNSNRLRILAGRNPCSLPLVPAGTLIWEGCEDFSEFSGDELSCEDAPQSRAHCGALSNTLGSELGGTSLTNSAEGVQGPGWFQDTSLFPLPGPSFLWVDASGASGTPTLFQAKTTTSPGGSQVNCPHPSSETLLIHNSRHHTLNFGQRVPCRWRSHTLHQTQSLQVLFCFVFPSGVIFHLLDIKVSVNCVVCMKLNMAVRKCGMAHSQWSCLCYWLRCNVFSIPLKTEIKFLWGSFGHQILLISFLRSFSYPFTWAEVTYLYGHSPRYKIMWNSSHSGRTEALLSWLELSCQMQEP